MTRNTSKSYQFLWPLLMAWRDSRRSKGKLLLFITAISLGIAALVGITSFRENLMEEINAQSKSLLGADVAIRGGSPLSDSLLQAHQRLASDMSKECYFASMVLFPRTLGTRLVQVRALEGNYPYYGEIETDPPSAAGQFQQGAYALVDEKLMLQYNVEVGDSVKVGTTLFHILGKLKRIPGQTNIGATASPVVYVPYSLVESTGLIDKGSRVNYLRYYLFDPEADTSGIWEPLAELTDKSGYDIDTIEDRKRETGRSFSDLTTFLELVAFVALLLGCIGVGSSIYVYTKEKTGIVATLRCLGMKSRQAISIYLIQVSLFGLIGAVFGSLLGVLLHLYLPKILADFVPITISSEISWSAVLYGVSIGVVISVLFALISLVSLRLVSPLQAIRADYGEARKWDWLQWLVGLIILLFIDLLVYLQIGSLIEASLFSGGLVAALVLLGLIGRGLSWLVKKLLPERLPFAWRQGLSNLYRPHNQTTLLIITLGLGTTFISTLFFMQNLLVDRVSIAGAEERPNTVLFDIQSPQREEVRQLTLDYDLPIIQEVPIVTMRLEEINGMTRKEYESDTTRRRPNWAFNREYRVTYRDSLIDSETLVGGTWTGTVEPGDTVFISIAKGFAENLEVDIGDKLLFNVQGALVETYVGSFRDIDWRRVQTNFLVLFPKGVLEKAPQFHVLITKIDNTELSARYQQAVVRSYPNVSIIDLELILKTLEDILGKVAFVIRFMALFSIGTGLIMLISSIILSRFQRMRENVLLRTLGASGNQLWKIIVAEYFFLGLLGALTGVILAIAFTMILGKFVFEFTFTPDLLQAMGIVLGVSLVTIFIGLLNSRAVIRQAPLEVLRKEI